MPSETRYMRSDIHIVYEPPARYILGTTQSDSARVYEDRLYPIPTIVQWQMNRVYRRTPTQMILLGGGAKVERNAPGAGIQSATWTPPQTALNPEDAIVVDIYTRDAVVNPIWHFIARWITVPLGAQSLDAVPWTVHYYTEIWETQEYNPFLDIWETVWYSKFKWGINIPVEQPFNSRIENFTWTPAPPAVKPAFGDGLVWIQG